jgi:thioredoxin 1
MAIIHVTATNFEEVKASDKTVLLDFYADWCGPCRMVAPILEDIASERDDVVIGKINVDDEGSLAHQFGVVSIPTLVVMKNGEIVHQSAGARPKAQILKLLES